MNAELLTVLNETLDELTEQQQEFRALIEEYHENVCRAEDELRSAESQKAHDEYLRLQVLQKSELLRNYISSLERQPCALLKKVKRLNEEQGLIDQALRQAESQVVSARSTLQSRQKQQGEAERRCEEIQKEWNEVSKHIGLVGHTE